mgnify:FL=1
MLEKIWKVKEKNIQKSSVFWNMMSSGINSVVFYESKIVFKNFD